MDPLKLEQFDYYLIRVIPSFKTERISRAHKIDLGAKTADLEFLLGDGGIAKDIFPVQEEQEFSKHVKCEYGATVKPKGEVQFGLLKGSVEGEAKWHRITNFVVSTINTYCYSSGTLTPAPSWVFQTRQGENYLSAQRELGLILQVPKGKRVLRSLKMFCGDIVLLDANHRELSGLKKFVTRIIKRIKSNPYYKPLTINFPAAKASFSSQYHETINRVFQQEDLDTRSTIQPFGRFSRFPLPQNEKAERWLFDLEPRRAQQAPSTKNDRSKRRKKREVSRKGVANQTNRARKGRKITKGADALQPPFTAPTIRFIEKELTQAKLSGEL